MAHASPTGLLPLRCPGARSGSRRCARSCTRVWRCLRRFGWSASWHPAVPGRRCRAGRELSQARRMSSRQPMQKSAAPGQRRQQAVWRMRHTRGSSARWRACRPAQAAAFTVVAVAQLQPPPACCLPWGCRLACCRFSSAAAHPQPSKAPGAAVDCQQFNR